MSEQELEELDVFLSSKVFTNMVEAQNRFINSGAFKGMMLAHGIIGILYLVLGIGLLRLKEWGRKATIVFQVLSVPLMVIFMWFMAGNFLNAIAEQSPEFDGMRQILPAFIAIQGLVVGLVAALIIRYLTRPRVKERFK
jgi:hypothetical protein